MSDEHTSNKPVLDEVAFKTTYIATFLAARMAERYINDCMNGHEGDPAKHQPVEDANYLANCAWNTIQEYL